VLYPGHALAQAHPDRLATLATLFGISSPSVETARVLELGCGDGLNLISIAHGLPNATCVGLDLASAGIKKGERTIDRLGLRNVTLLQGDICEITTELGSFDYIIAHGLYSWVPPHVRDHLLRICRDKLAPNGVAYISYNTYPGCHQRQMVRGMMRFHVEHMDSPADQVAQGRALVGFIAERCTADPDFYRPVLERELKRLKECLDSSVFHDDLAETNHPVHFHEFIEHASKHGLQYLAEAHFFEMQSGIFSAETVGVVNQISDDRIAKEQYLDFLKCRSFRQTLLVHTEQKVDVDVTAERITSLYVASPLTAQTTVTDLASDAAVTFVGPKKASLTTDNPLIQAAFVCLGERWPQAVRFQELQDRAQIVAHDAGGRSQDTAADTRMLAETLLRAYAGGLIELSVFPPRLVTSPGNFPVVSALARVQAEEGSRVTNLRYHNLQIDDPLCMELLRLLDGTRDRSRLIQELSEHSGVARALSGAMQAGAEKSEVREAIDESLDDRLEALCRMALVTA
jgi:methyltransferase-like protein/cyclopropane fatty-acyl-phospholipid synthase-like methyltransferase